MDNTPWYKNAVIYQLHVKCFLDSNSDGIGDFPGLVKKLDYIKSLGITAIWLLPCYPSPLKDDGYDIADYYSIHSNYGRLSDFKLFLKEAHKRKLKVITELVINHTSDQHKWFQKSRKAKASSKWHNFYMWSDSQEKFKDARIIFKDFENSNWAFDTVKKAYYWHRFYSHQPDLNFDHPLVKQEIFKILDFWFSLGVDGLRLDAIPYLYAREGTNCENLPETHVFLKELRAYVDQKYKDRMLLAEANQWPEDAVSYFGNGRECHMAFHFPVMPRMFMAIQMEDRFPILDILEQTPKIPEECQWAMFLRNHDELTLEMVTDEERDYMYRVYAKDSKARINLGIRRRLAPLLDNNRSKFELMNILLFSLPGTPVIYYGDEIGMGDNYYLGDRNGVRTPMQWSGDRNGGFSKANPQQLYLPLIIDPQYHYENINVENQELNPSSLLWWMRNVLTLRNQYKAFGNGSLKFFSPKNPRVLSFIREFEDEKVLVVVNLSKCSQYVELELCEFRGFQPSDIFSENKFPEIKETGYGISLGPYGYYWLLLKKEPEFERLREDDTLPELSVSNTSNFLDGLKKMPQFFKILKEYMPKCRWFCSKTQSIQKIEIKHHIRISKWHVFVFSVLFDHDKIEYYQLPLTLMEKENPLADSSIAAICLVKGQDKEMVCLDALFDKEFRSEILQMISKRRIFYDCCGNLVSHRGKDFFQVLNENPLPSDSRILKGEQSNTSFVFDELFYLKHYRKVEEGENPDLEMIKHLTENQKLHNIPSYAGDITFKTKSGSVMTFLQLQKFVKNQGDAWSLMVEFLKRIFEDVRSAKGGNIKEAPVFSFLGGEVDEKKLDPFPEWFGSLESAKRIGKCTAELHLALANPKKNPSFTPEPLTLFDQRALYESMRLQMKQLFKLLKEKSKDYPEKIHQKIDVFLEHEKSMQSVIKEMVNQKFNLLKIRIHGDYHLGQLMDTGREFFILDFEGEPLRSLVDRKKKKLVLQDLAGMIRSFFYASYWTLYKHKILNIREIELMEPWAGFWGRLMSYHFYSSYMSHMAHSNLPLFPIDRNQANILLEIFLLDKSMYEIRYELNERPEWLGISLSSNLDMIAKLQNINVSFSG